jgi:hypothetical protein
MQQELQDAYDAWETEVVPEELDDDALEEACDRANEMAQLLFQWERRARARRELASRERDWKTKGHEEER